MRIVPYLNLSGNAEEALRFYREIFGGEATVMRWADMPSDPPIPADDAWSEKIMHASLSWGGGLTIYLSDTAQENDRASGPVVLHIEFDSEEELRRVFARLSEGGTVNMPVDRTFWGSVYGDVVDRFGIAWGLEYALPE